MNTPLDKIEHSVVSFSGTTIRKDSLEKFYLFVLRWFERLGCVPYMVGADGPKMAKFKSKDRELRSKGFHHLDHISVCSIPEEVKHELEGYNVDAALVKKYRHCFFDSRSSILAIGSPEIVEVAREITALTSPRYGIGYRRTFEFGPAWYAMGIGKGDIDEEEGCRISQWIEGETKEVYNHGQIRDVYPWNFLNTSQLNAKIGKQTLADWIRDKPSRGTLAPFANDLTLWTVEDKHIPSLQKPLHDAGIIFDYERDIWAKQHHSPITTEEALGQVLTAMGYTPEEAQVLQVEKPGQTRELSTEEVRTIQNKRKKAARKP